MLKMGKFLRVDGVTVEMLKSRGDVVVEWMYKIFMYLVESGSAK